MARCLVTRALPGAELARLSERHEVEVWPGELPPGRDWLIEHVRDAEGLLCLLTDRIDAELLASARELRVISNFAVGCDNIDLAAAAERGIVVGRTPDVLTDATADLTIALMLAVARHLPAAEQHARSGEWRTWEPAGWLGLELRGATLAIVGPGRIGRAVATRAEAFGMDVTLVGRTTELRTSLAGADVVSLHAPLTAATRHLIDAATLRAMRPGAILINTSRGGLIDQTALRIALESGHLGGAGLDVTDPEPPAPEDPLLGAPNLIVLPHIGSATHKARAAMTQRSVENLLAGLEGEPLPYPQPLVASESQQSSR
ncbi:MAG TPA: D-glycerate dehydrogenase [Solirubrobacteraceae bacterium]